TPSKSPLFPYTTLFRSLCEVNYRGLRGAVDSTSRGAANSEPRGRIDDSAGPLRDHMLECSARAEKRPSEIDADHAVPRLVRHLRSEEHTSELQSRVDLV